MSTGPDQVDPPATPSDEETRPNRVELTPLSFLERAAYAFGARTALVHREQRYTYRDLRRRVHRLASALVASGVEPGDRVAVLAPNSPVLLESHFGVPLAGAVLVAINIRLASDEIAYILQHSGAKTLLVDSELVPLVAPVLDRCPALRTVVCVQDNAPAIHASAPDVDAIPYERFLEAGVDDIAAPPHLREDGPISINYTSGTTGKPKGVI